MVDLRNYWSELLAYLRGIISKVAGGPSQSCRMRVLPTPVAKTGNSQSCRGPSKVAGPNIPIIQKPEIPIIQSYRSGIPIIPKLPVGNGIFGIFGKIIFGIFGIIGRGFSKYVHRGCTEQRAPGTTALHARNRGGKACEQLGETQSAAVFGNFRQKW